MFFVGQWRYQLISTHSINQYSKHYTYIFACRRVATELMRCMDCGQQEKSGKDPKMLPIASPHTVCRAVMSIFVLQQK